MTVAGKGSTFMALSLPRLADGKLVSLRDLIHGQHLGRSNAAPGDLFQTVLDDGDLILGELHLVGMQI